MYAIVNNEERQLRFDNTCRLLKEAFNITFKVLTELVGVLLLL